MRRESRYAELITPHVNNGLRAEMTLNDRLWTRCIIPFLVVSLIWAMLLSRSQPEGFSLSGLEAIVFLLGSTSLSLILGTMASRAWETRNDFPRKAEPGIYILIICAGITMALASLNQPSEFQVYLLLSLTSFEAVLVWGLENIWKRGRSEKGDAKLVSVPPNPLTAEAITRMNGYPDFEKLELRQRKYTQVDLSPLTQCHNLRVLDLMLNKIESIDLTPLSSCTNLQMIILPDNMLEVIDLSPLSGLENLELLNIQLNKLASIDLEPLRGCPNLQILHLGGNINKQIDLSPLSECKELRRLSFENLGPKVDLTPLQDCVKLEELSIYGRDFEEIDLGPLRNCTNLEFLGFAIESLEILDFSPLESCKNLHDIEFNSNSPKVIDVTGLFSIPGFNMMGWIDSSTRLVASIARPEKQDWPQGLKKYQRRIDFEY